MRKYLRILLLVLVIALAMGMVAMPKVSALTLQEGAAAARCTGCPEDLFGENGVFWQITNTVLYVVGVIAVVMLIVGGVRYVISGGDPKKVTDAKNTVLYAIIGLVICFFSYAIVHFVITTLPSAENPATTSDAQGVMLVDSTKG